MTLPGRVSQPLECVWMVVQWKWDLDPDTPWYRKWWLKIFRLFIHFSWNVMKIPCPKGMEIEGDKQRIIWAENQGFFSSEDQAEIACITEWTGYKDVPMDRRFPLESAQYSSLVFPRQKNPRQHRRAPTFHIVSAPRSELEQLKEEVTKLREEIRQARQ
jgi:hypothetical protein